MTLRNEWELMAPIEQPKVKTKSHSKICIESFIRAGRCQAGALDFLNEATAAGQSEAGGLEFLNEITREQSPAEVQGDNDVGHVSDRRILPSASQDEDHTPLPSTATAPVLAEKSPRGTKPSVRV